ncbi:MAG: hypothetical protein V4619_05555 [Bacteroidota bacterium]|jgi:hypothetical protein|uniref:hypothetical protein n=1 Tax=Mucilaginibacter TaxID=423349 RepID=UPI00334CC93E
MSGSSGGSFGGGFSPEPNCEKLNIKINLASPVPEVIDDLVTGEVLTVSLDGPAGPITAVTTDGDVAGAILVSDPAKLISCMNDGFNFMAKVLSKTGGDCQVAIYCIGK